MITGCILLLFLKVTSFHTVIKIIIQVENYFDSWLEMETFSVYTLRCDGSVVSFQKTAVAVLASVVVFLKIAVAVLMRLC